MNTAKPRPREIGVLVRRGPYRYVRHPLYAAGALLFLGLGLSTTIPSTVAAIALALANFMVILDLTIANVSIPHVAGSLGITLEQGAWIITSYAVAEAICVPLTGWIAGRFGSVRTFVVSMVGFGILSFLCGISITMGMLVACRIGQGIFGAFLQTFVFIMLTMVYIGGAVAAEEH